ncbi:transketolase [Flaviflagellibacter deserti]|uniref:Transketolase n=1 Tax=Flaviflagellibacter deserti TaxID=2267266 RepID=A0ABV9YX39_9HYPH
MTSRETHDRMANALRFLAMDAVEKAKSGHPGLPMGAADVATVLFTQFLKFDPKDPHWPDRDRFVLSAGHGSMLLYGLLHLVGYDSVSIEDIKNFRQLESVTPGHPENFKTLGIETTTGPLGQGLGNAVGMALAERLLNAEFGDDIVDHHTYVLCSDGDLMEGISQESIAIAGHLKLNKLIAFWDDNGISIDGPLTLSDSVDQVARFKAANWNAFHIDGHDPEAIANAIRTAQASDKPTLIACKTTIGFGAPTKAGKSSAHGSPLGKDEIEATRKALNWEYPPFELPNDVLDFWRGAGERAQGDRSSWLNRLASADVKKREEFERRTNGILPADLGSAFQRLKDRLIAEPQEVATRKSSELVLDAIADTIPELLSGSADLTPSNNTKVKAFKEVTPGDFAGRYIHWGIREHGMCAALNGIALHGGIIPMGATFLVFSDYCRPSIRLASLMGQRIIYVFTHDSIGVGEDGPTHQPVEHVAALRAIPHLLVFRPADTIETAEAWELAIRHTDRPSLLALTRQNLKQARLEPAANLTERGAYEIRASKNGEAEISIFASGSEVSLAIEAYEKLSADGIATRVVSVPCMELFDEQDAGYRASVIGNAKVKVGVEAAIRMGWDHIIGLDGIFVGMPGFGASGPANQVYEHFGITTDAVVSLARKRLGR